MDMDIQLKAPETLEQVGKKETAPKEARRRTAVVVAHGMGQQVPFETLNDVAEGLLKVAGETGKVTAQLVLVRGSDDDTMLPRLSITVKGEPVDLYEVYWAPLTEGAISFRETMAFFIRAGIGAIVRAMCAGPFRRRVFDSMPDYRIPVSTSLFLFLATLVSVLVAFALVAVPLLGVALLSRGRDAIALENGIPLLLTVVPIWLLYKIRGFIRQFFGDVVIYIDATRLDRFWRIRGEIKRVAQRTLEAVLAAKEAGKLRYDRVCIFGHSLGSVIAYDMINAAINRDCASGERLRAAERITSLVTFGSPLDKTAYLFRYAAGEKPLREALAACVQPLIQDYRFRPRKWINIYAKGDIISGPLDYYDPPESTHSGPLDYYDPPESTHEPKRIRNEVDPEASLMMPSAHTGYWEHAFVHKRFFEAVTQDGTSAAVSPQGKSDSKAA